MNIVITGASSGIGFETAKALSAIPGNKLVLIARNSHKIQMLAGECNVLRQETAVYPIPYDLSKGKFEQLAKQIFQNLGPVDILINNAGAILNKPFGNITSDEIDQVYDVNVKAPFLLIQAMLPFLNKNAHIVNIGSMGGVQGSTKFPGLSVYSSSKGALAVLTECLAAELEEQGIQINCLAIGSVQTEMLSKAFPGYSAPLTAGRMAEFIANFALNGQKYFNGKVLPVSLSTP
jgi:NAD(P)-dependent dehydrogenase (short-subunit alcohol dehydrogenase family)